MLTFDRVSVEFDRRPILSDVSVAIPAGSLTAVLGPNGSGKTTLLRLAAGVIAPASGHVRLGDRDVASIPRRDLARRLAVVPQETTLAFDYTAAELVLMGRYPHLRTFEVEGPADVEAADRAMAATGTREFAARLFRTLSGGEKQRVVIASALAQLDAAVAVERPAAGTPSAAPVLLLDEPTASLDVRYQIEIMTLLRRLHGDGLTIVLTTHDLRLARALCSEVVLLAQGGVLATGRAADLLTTDRLIELFEIDPALAAPLLA
jgi:iron complex transport system ATP-binding protein